MAFTMEWNIICRVCLQEGEMFSIFENDNEMLISDKIMQCTNVKIERGVNLPENICKKCLDHLRVAYAFRNNCESSDAVLQSFINGNAVRDLVICSNGEVYKYKPPRDLKVKRIPKEEKSDFIKEETMEVLMLEDPKADSGANDENFVESGEFERFEELVEEEGDTDGPPSPQPPDDRSSPTHDHPSITEDSMSPFEISEKTEDESNSNHTSEQNMASISNYMMIDQDPNIFTVKADHDNSSVTLFEGSMRRKNDSEVIIEPIIIVTRQPKPPKPRAKPKGDKPMHICEICGNSYKQRHSLETHMRRHRNEKPFACEICGRRFVLNVELKTHMRTHTGQKPYPCRFCGRRFSDFGSRIKHERTHTGERPYACDTCGKAFAYSYGLSSHILTHTGEKRFECSKCDKRFAKKHHLKNHMNTHIKQETRLKPEGYQAPTDINLNATSNSEFPSSEDEYGSMLTIFTEDEILEQSLDQFLNINAVGIKKEMNEDESITMEEITEISS